MMKRKLLFFVPDTVGGAERVTLTVAKLAKEAGHDVKVVMLPPFTGKLADFIPDDIPIETIRFKDYKRLPFLKIRSLLKRDRPYAVFSSLFFINIQLIIAARMAGGIKIICRNDNSISRNSRLKLSLIKRLYRRADILVMQQQEMADECQRAIKGIEDKLRVIPNPIDTGYISKQLKEAENPFAKPDATNYLYFGRISPEKRIDDLIRAFSIVAKQSPDARLTLVGDKDKFPDLTRRLQSLVTTLGLVGRVEFTGFETNPYKYVKYCDCSVLTSEIEGCPNSLLESMWLMKPVVATRSIPLISRIVTPDRGYTADVGDTEAIAEAMLKAIDLKIEKPYVYGSNDEFVKLFD